MDKLTVNNKEYEIIKLLGHGKGGYSYLATDGINKYVLKQIHHEPCSYYNFGNKIEAERNDYERLLNAGIRIPKMIEIDIENERLKIITEKKELEEEKKQSNINSRRRY